MTQRGFTLVELIVSMIIIGIMAIAVVPRMDSLRGYGEIGFRDQVKATLEYARKSAVAGRRYVCVNVTGGGNGLAVTRDQADPDTRTLATISCTFALNLPGTQANTVVAPTSVAFGVPSAVIIFDPLGRAWGPASDCTPSSTTQYCYSIKDASSPTAQIVFLERETGYVR
jgi:MSHA pilin protein MshC